MKIISHHEILRLNVSPRTCFEWVNHMIANKDKALLPPKISMKLGEGIFCNVMPSVVELPDGRQFGGVKIVTRYPDRTPSLDSKLILFDAKSGEQKAVMDANWITAMRTGAVATHSLRLFAKKNCNKIGFIGLGNAARATMAVFAEMCDRDIDVKLLRYKGQEELFEKRFSECKNLRFEYCDNPQQLISGVDAVISAATYLTGDLCPDSAFSKGILVIPIHTLGFTNCDLFFDKVFADDVNHVKHFKYFDRFHSFSEVSDVVNGRAEGRTDEEERILVYNIGVAMHDVYFAANIFEMLEAKNCRELDFCSPKEKFWI